MCLSSLVTKKIHTVLIQAARIISHVKIATIAQKIISIALHTWNVPQHAVWINRHAIQISTVLASTIVCKSSSSSIAAINSSFCSPTFHLLKYWHLRSLSTWSQHPSTTNLSINKNHWKNCQAHIRSVFRHGAQSNYWRLKMNSKSRYRRYPTPQAGRVSWWRRTL